MDGDNRKKEENNELTGGHNRWGMVRAAGYFPPGRSSHATPVAQKIHQLAVSSANSIRLIAAGEP
jgi:hypothetical protein